MSESGQKQSQTEGRSNLLPLDTGNESNLTIVLPPPGIIKIIESLISNGNAANINSFSKKKVS